jgi:hypothetical protein
MMGTMVELQPAPVATSVDELLAGATSREPFLTTDSKSGALFERVVIDGERFVVKYLHVDRDWIMRAAGDLSCWPVQAWKAGLMGAAPACIDPAVIGAAVGLGRHGWGGALLMRDVSDSMVPPGDDPLDPHQAERFVDHMAQFAARFWGWRDDVGLLPYGHRWSIFNDAMVACEAARGFPETVPTIVRDGWRRFGERAGAELSQLIHDLCAEPWALVDALRTTPSTFLHGDWKFGNLGADPAGRTVLIDWANPGEGPACADLTWYLALNRARLPHAKEDAIEWFRAGLERAGIGTDGWFERQLGLAFVGAMVQFGWEKALGDDDELGWWRERALAGAHWL